MDEPRAKPSDSIEIAIASLDRRLDDKISTVAKDVEALDRLIAARLSEVNTKIAAQADKVELALTASDKAISKAENATEKRFEAVNEFRSTLSDQARDFLARGEYGANHAALVDKLDALTARIGRIEAIKTGGREAFTGLYLFLGIILAAATIVGLVIGLKH